MMMLQMSMTISSVARAQYNTIRATYNLIMGAWGVFEDRFKSPPCEQRTYLLQICSLLCWLTCVSVLVMFMFPLNVYVRTETVRHFGKLYKIALCVLTILIITNTNKDVCSTNNLEFIHNNNNNNKK